MNALTTETRDRLTPAEVLRRLAEGNERFCKNEPADRDLLQQVSETAEGQAPMAVVLSCIDSRVSAELVFDQGVGDIFSVRIAGNFVNDDILGSMEFACQVAGAKLVVVLGHSGCGAIKGACDGVELGLLTGALAKLEPAVDAVDLPAEPEHRGSHNADFVQAVAEENVRQTVAAITQRSEVLRELADGGRIELVGAMYDVKTGAVRFL